MPRKKQALPQEVMEKMILASVGNSTTIHQVIGWVFGKKRVREALKNPRNDPEVVEFIMQMDTNVNKEWERRGIPRRMGPYVE